MMSDDAYREDGVHNLYGAGQKVNLINKAYFENGRQSRIIGFEYELDMPYDHPVYTVGETASYSRIGELEGKLDSLTLAGQTYTGGNGSGVYLITLNDNTQTSDRNAYSARRAQSEFLSKKHDDKASGIITFLKGLISEGLIQANGGINFEDFIQGSNGASIWKDEHGSWHIEIDYAHIRKKFTAEEVEIMKTSHIGGKLVQTAARMICVRVEELEDSYRCYFVEKDSEGRIVYNQFKEKDQAFVETFNLQQQADGKIGNHFLWRLVTGIGSNYIDLSKSDMATGSDIPAVGDEIVQLGYRGSDPDRNSATIQAGAGNGAPYYRMYSGINSYTLPKPLINLDPKGSEIQATLHIEKGSTGASNISDLPDEIQTAVQIGGENLLLNTGFTGDYETKKLAEDSVLDTDTELYSTRLKHWSGTATVNEDPEAVSGYSTTIGNLSQPVHLIANEVYVISYRAKGNITVISCGDYHANQSLTKNYTKYVHKFVHKGAGIFSMSGDATVCDLKLERGTITTDWCPARQDTDKIADRFNHIRYIANAIKDGSVDILGGLILANMIQLGNYKDGVMEKVTAGISGIYNDDDDVFAWGGGSLEKAIHTVMMFKDNPAYQPTEEELKSIANIVFTHGGRAILNDVVVRGYIYALGIRVKDFAKLASAVIDKDYLFSQQGVDSKGDFTEEYTKRGTNDFIPNLEMDFRTGTFRGNKIEAEGYLKGGYQSKYTAISLNENQEKSLEIDLSKGTDYVFTISLGTTVDRFINIPYDKKYIGISLRISFKGVGGLAGNSGTLHIGGDANFQIKGENASKIFLPFGFMVELLGVPSTGAITGDNSNGVGSICDWRIINTGDFKKEGNNIIGVY